MIIDHSESYAITGMYQDNDYIIMSVDLVIFPICTLSAYLFL
jgi:hypothetical protein